MEIQKKMEKLRNTQTMKITVKVNGEKVQLEGKDPKQLYAFAKRATANKPKIPPESTQEEYDKIVREHIRHSIPMAQDLLFGIGKRFHRTKVSNGLEIARKKYAETNIGHWRKEKIEESNGKKFINPKIEWVWDSCTTKE